MADYTHEYSNFPNEIMEKHNFKDVTNEIAVMINTIKSLQSQGLYDEAAKIIRTNASVLKPYNIDMTTVNGMIEHIRNTEIYATGIHQSVHTDVSEPDICLESDIWIGGE